MLIYVPGVLSHSQSISTPTSHIDITPTIFDLLGISEGRQLEQGSSVLSPGIEKRRLFLSMDIFGASGYYDRGYYYSRGPLDVVYKSPTMNFSDKDALLYDSKEAESVRAVLVDQDTRQSELLFRVLNGEYR
jgi:arylsulfatase A-like enzyme